MTDEFVEDVSEEREKIDQVFQYLQLSDTADRQFTADDALNLANLSRYYVDPTPDLAAAVAQSGISWENPLLAEIMFDDSAEQEKDFWDKVYDVTVQPFKAGVRGVGATVEAAWEEGFYRPMRTGIRAYQDDTDQSIMDSYNEAGASDLAIAAGEASQGNRVNWGTGLMPSSELAHEQKGFGTELIKGTQERVEGGADPLEAYGTQFDEQSEAVYADIGQPITYQGQQARESTLISYGDRITPFSLGRAAAIRVSDPNSMLFNTISGGIDATARVMFDPLNVPANELGLAWKARNAIVPVDNVREAGLVASRRPWVNPKTANEWFSKGRGTRMVDTLTETESIYEINRLVPELPGKAQRALASAGTNAQVQDILRPYMGTVLDEAPTLGMRQTLGDKVFGDSNAMTIRNWDNPMGQFVRRWTAESGDVMVSAHNIDHAVVSFRAQMETAGASVDEMDRIITKVFQAEGDTMALRAVQGEMHAVIGKRLDELGYNGQDAREIMRMISDEQEKAQIYLQDLAAHPIELEGADFLEVVMPDGTKTEIPINGAQLDSEFAEHTIIMSNLREIRRATSRPRAVVDKLVHERMGWDPRGIQAGRLTQGMDAMQSVWRTFALARMGWTFRVIGEEVIRKRAAGYSHMVETPGQALLAAMTDSSMTDIYGDNLGDFFKMKGLGATGFKRDLTNDIMRGTRFDRARQGWTPVQTRTLRGHDPVTGQEIWEWTAKGREGIATEFIQLGNADTANRLATMSVDEVMDFYKTPEGMKIVDDIVLRSGGGLTSKIKNRVHLRRYVESVDARRHGMTGGDYIYRKMDDPIWRTSNGKEWDGNPHNMNGTQVDKQLQEMGVTGPRGGKIRGSLADRQARLAEEMGMPNVTDYGDAQFIVVKNGQDDLLEMLGTDRIHGEMTKAEMLELEELLPAMFDEGGSIPPAFVKGVDGKLEARLHGAYDNVVNSVFSTIMEKPTMAINRSPFAKTRYTEEMARFSVWSDDATRARIMDWAEANGVLDELVEFQKADLRARGLKTNKMPTVEKPFTSFEELDQLAKAKAVDDAKALFYDLAQKGNWADAIRFIAPFADAWWEVISRWGQMLAPSASMGGMGQAVKNWERIRQGSQAIDQQIERRTGMFAENEFGDRVFNVPGMGLLSPTVRDNYKSSVAMSSMLFVDPTEGPRGILVPGAGPMMQFPAQLVTPLVEKFLGQHMADQLNSFVFGDFPPGELTNIGGLVEPFLPTHTKRLIAALLDEDKIRHYADEIVGTYSAFLINEDDRHGDRTKEQSKLTLEQARKTGEQMAYGRVADSLFGPMSPTYTPVAIVEMADGTPQGNLMLSMVAVGDELRTLEEIYGDETMARQVFMEMYGFDPLNVTSKTTGVYARPFSEEGYEQLKDNPELREFNYTLMMFIDEGDQADFYGPAWRDQFLGDDPARVKVTPEVGRQIISRQKGQMVYEELVRVYDEAKRQAEGKWGKGSISLRAYREELDAWKYGQTQNISSTYFAWGNDKEIAGGTERPTSQMMYDEVMSISRQGTTARTTALKHRPELVNFIDEIALVEEQMKQNSLDRGHKEDWWRGSPSMVDGQPKRDVQEWYVNKVQTLVDQMEDGESKYAARWMQERIFIYMLEKTEFDDDQIHFEPLEPPALRENWIEEVTP